MTNLGRVQLSGKETLPIEALIHLLHREKVYYFYYAHLFIGSEDKI